MKKRATWQDQLTRRERQVMNILLSSGEATASEIQEAMPEAPSYSAVRALLRVMEEKGVITHANDGPRYVYRSTMPARQARKTALAQLLKNLFQGSREQVVAALLDPADSKITREELERMEKLIQQAKEQGL